MKLGMSSAAFFGLMPTELEAEKAAGMPVDAVEVFLETYSEYSADFGRVVREHLHGKPCLSVHPRGTQFEPDIFGRSARQVKDGIAMFTRVCEAGEALGARYYIMHGTFDNRGSRLRPRGIYRLRENMELLRQIAASHHLEVLWENVFWCTARTPEDIADIREILPEQRFVLDVKQAWRAGTEPMAMIDAMGPKLAHVHALDHTPDMQKLALPGSGVLDWPALIHRMRGYGFDGAILLEPYAWQCADDGDTRRCLKYLRTCIQEEEARCTDGNA